MCDGYSLQYTINGITEKFTYTKKNMTFKKMIEELINSGKLESDDYLIFQDNEMILPLKSKLNQYSNIIIQSANMLGDNNNTSDSDSTSSESSDKDGEISNESNEQAIKSPNYRMRRKSDEVIQKNPSLIVDIPRRQSCDDKSEKSHKLKKEEKKEEKRKKKDEKKRIKQQKKEEKNRKKEEKKIKKEEAKQQKFKEKEMKKTKKDSTSSQENDNLSDSSTNDFHKSKKKHDKRLKRYFKKYGEKQSSFSSDSDEADHLKHKASIHSRSEPIHQSKKNLAFFLISQPRSLIEYNYRDDDTIENASLFIGLNQRAFRVTILCRGHILNKCVPLSSLPSSREDPLIAVLERRTVLRIQSARGCVKLRQAEIERNKTIGDHDDPLSSSNDENSADGNN